MKKTAFVLLIAMMGEILMAASPVSTLYSDPIHGGRDARTIMISIGGSKNTVSLYDLSKLDRESLESKTGRKMNFVERISFKRAQKKLRKAIDSDGYIKDEKLVKQLSAPLSGDTGFHFGGFALGFFLGVIGIVIAYVAFNKDDEGLRKNRIKWMWIGFGAAVILFGGLLLAALSSI